MIIKETHRTSQTTTKSGYISRESATRENIQDLMNWIGKGEVKVTLVNKDGTDGEKLTIWNE